MPATCSVPFCHERSGGHKFPRDRVLRQKWITAIRRVNFVPTAYSKVCKRHFTKEDYKLPKESTLKTPGLVLKKDVVPSVFSWNVYSSGKQKKKINTKTILNQRCSVLQCKSGSSKNIILHTCPNQERVRKKWAEVFKVNRDVVKNMLICSQHFLKSDYISSKNSDFGVLKQNAVPSQKLPRSTRVINTTKKVISSKKKQKIVKRPQKMTEVVIQEEKVDEHVEIRQCRACLKKIEDNISVCFIFQSWVPPWTGMAASIAEDLAKLASVEILESDNLPNSICEPCYQKLLNAAAFAAKVRVCDNILRSRCSSDPDHTERTWPKPIQVDRNINGEELEKLDIEIKKEIIDEEYETIAPDSTYGLNNSDPALGNLDIKSEPEDYVEAQPLTISINETVSLNPTIIDNKTVLNGFDDYEAIISDSVSTEPILNGIQTTAEQQCLEATIKQEPISEDEDSEYVRDLSLECILCTKLFNSVTGLKAHVIANHSYKSVKRKTEDSESPKRKRDEYRCEICRRSFTTSTDLMVHETCHNKFSCYGCNNKFDSFKQLSKHRKWCKASRNNTVIKPKTLDDVIRTMKEEKLDQEDSHDSNMELLLEIHSNKKKTKLITETESSNIANENICDMEIKEETT